MQLTLLDHLSKAASINTLFIYDRFLSPWLLFSVLGDADLRSQHGEHATNARQHRQTQLPPEHDQGLDEAKDTVTRDEAKTRQK